MPTLTKAFDSNADSNALRMRLGRRCTGNLKGAVAPRLRPSARRRKREAPTQETKGSTTPARHAQEPDFEVDVRGSRLAGFKSRALWRCKSCGEDGPLSGST